MESQLKKLYSIVESVVACRRELALATGQFSQVEHNIVMFGICSQSYSQATALLAATEESHHLSRSLEGLARVEEKVEGTLQEQADTDFAHILELVRDYLSLVAAVKVSSGWRLDFMKPVSGGARRASEGFLNLANCSYNSSQVFGILQLSPSYLNPH